MWFSAQKTFRAKRRETLLCREFEVNPQGFNVISCSEMFRAKGYWTGNAPETIKVGFLFKAEANAFKHLGFTF